MQGDSASGPLYLAQGSIPVKGGGYGGHHVFGTPEGVQYHMRDQLIGIFATYEAARSAVLAVHASSAFIQPVTVGRVQRHVVKDDDFLEPETARAWNTAYEATAPRE